MVPEHLPNPPARTYAARRPFAMVGDLADLTGLAEGVVELPVVLDWSPKRRYDLGDRGDRRRLYEIVIREALREEHLRDHLSRDVLLEMWPQLVLPRHVAARWEAAFPELAARGGAERG